MLILLIAHRRRSTALTLGVYRNWIFKNTETEFRFTKITEITEITETETENSEYN